MYPIPTTAFDHHIAVLGKTGSGKTTAIKGGVERALDAGSRVCIVDPTAAWWGMKSSSTGKSAAYPFVIFGGLHADFQIAASTGEAIAEIVGTSNTPAIIDTSQMRVRERTQFFADFADAIMRKNRGPLHLVIDEAHVFMPQGKVPDPQSGVMLAAGCNLVSGGRSRGLRVTLITQRPAKLHKDALTQVETLVAMRLIAPQDRAAVQEWIKDNADPAKGREIIESLATLKTGQGWVWAPELGLLERVSFPRIRTFDSSAAPTTEDGDKGPVLAAIDRDVISERLKTHAAEVLANDPVELRKRIRELERQLQDRPTPAIDPGLLERRISEAFDNGENHGFLLGWDAYETALRARMPERPTGIGETQRPAIDCTEISSPGRLNGAPPENPQRSGQPPSRPAVASHEEPNRNRADGARSQRQIDGGAPVGDISSAARKILSVLAQHRAGCESGKLALLTGYSYSGGFRNALSELRSAGLIEGSNTSTMRITAAGLGCGPFPKLPTGPALVAHWLQHPSFSKCARDVLKTLIDNKRGLTAEQLCRITGYEYSGGFRNALSELRTAGVIIGSNKDTMRVHEDLL